MIKKMIHNWHWFWFKHHLNWLTNDYKKEAWKAIYEAFNQVLNEVSAVADVKALEPMNLEDFIKSPHYYNVLGNDRIDGQKVCKINKGENHG